MKTQVASYITISLYNQNTGCILLQLLIHVFKGPVDKDGKRLYLFVMPLMNKSKQPSLYVQSYIAAFIKPYSVGDLDKQFTTYKCILEYMDQQKKTQKFIFRNYLALFCQVFEALRYLKEQQIVHRDIKCKLTTYVYLMYGQLFDGI